MKVLMIIFIGRVKKKAWNSYFSMLNNTNKHWARDQIKALGGECLNFLNFLMDTISSMKSKVVAPDFFIDAPNPNHNIWYSFMPVSVD